MKVVILAAGVGSRLEDLTKNKPKCMLNINGQSLIKYQIENLKRKGIKDKDIYIIGGHKIDSLKKHLSNYKVNIIFNPKYKEWNNIYSFYLIKDIPDLQEFILINSDTYFHPFILEKLLNSKKSDVIVLDTSKELGDEEMKVIAEKGKIKKFGKDISPEEAKGEYIGLAKFNKNTLEPLFEEIKNLIESGRTDLWYELAFNNVLPQMNIGYIDTENFPWIEIDTLEDYEKAQKLLLD